MYKNFIEKHTGKYFDRFYNPYPSLYSDSTTHKDKNYRKVLFKPGPIQAAELNELQSMIHYSLKTISDSIYKNSGALLTDPVIDIMYYDKDYKEVSAEFASYYRVTLNNNCSTYFDGTVIEVPIRDFSYIPMYDGQLPNNHFLGLYILEEGISANEDASLADPQILVDNAIASDSTSDRYKISAQWKFSNELTDSDELTSFLSIYFFTGGILINANNPIPELKVVTSVAARYDRIAHGNYVNNGLTTSFRDRLAGNGGKFYHRFLIAPGNANVDGYNFNFPETSQLVLEDVSLNEGYVFTASDIEIQNFSAISNKSYNLAYFHGLIEILSITGIKSNGPVAITRGSNQDDATVDLMTGMVTGNSDSVNQSFYITKIALTNPDGSINTSYVQGVDYKISSDLRSIEWFTTNQPEWGDTYFVKYWYNFTYTNNDINPLFKFSPTDAVINSDKTRVTIKGSLFDSSCTKVEVSFKHNPPRKDLIILSHKSVDNQEIGSFERVLGRPSLEYLEIPVINNEKSISIAEVVMQYGKVPVINIDYYTVFKMSDIQKLERRLESLEYNVARVVEQHRTSMDEPDIKSKDLFVDLFSVKDSKRDKPLETALLSQI